MTKDNRSGGLYRNAISYFGGLVVIISALFILFFLLVNFSLAQPNPYIGIFTYMIFPGFLTLGIVIFLYGMLHESRRRRKLGTEEARPYPALDLNIPSQRRKFGFILVGGSFLALLLAFVGYNSYLFTESVTFCGKVCHTVMKPEYTAYKNGPHARVACVECHVGSGVSWYVKSKLSGAQQVLAVALHDYPTPIPVPIKNLRPARETCEECHWPQKFYGAQLVQIPHFRYDKDNTPEQISLLVKTGGGSPKLGENAGIHWHMIIDNQVYFRATDPQLQHIPWVKIVSKNGKSTIYEDKRAGLSAKQIAKLPLHKMDCMDCHNRPAHVFPPPEKAVNTAMEANKIPRDLPWIKKLGVDSLTHEYKNNDAAHKGIKQAIDSFYQEKFPQVLKDKKGEVEEAVHVLDEIYDRSVFPAMHVNWKTYPDNLGHRNWPGCFRCHDGHHVSKAGQTIPRDCTDCHTMPQRGPLMPLGATAPKSSENWHPWKLEGKHAQILCSRCHQAGYRPPQKCATCHKIDTSKPMMSFDCSTCHLKTQQVKPLVDCTTCHNNLSGLHKKGGHPYVDCWTCHKPHVFKVSTRATCLQCHTDKKDHHKGIFCGNCHQFTAG